MLNIPSTKMPCKNCKDSSGLVPHVKRKIGNTDVDDPADFQTEEICPICNGSGSVPYISDKPASE